ncbi:hypothetical protein J3459_009824 [Metarhizium acridum]|nr:hypothetical protein J3459_009824 [Metarhizium acridum]
MSFLVYFATYATANCFDSFYARDNCTDPAVTSVSPCKFFATTAVSIGSSVYKDGYFANAAGRAPAPPLTYALLTARDVVTLFASCTLPTIIAPELAVFSSSAISRAYTWFSSEETRLQFARVVAPVAAQIVSTPIHLLGLDVHHRRDRVSAAARLNSVWRHSRVCAPLRMIRIIPAFGIGGAANTDCRAMMLSHLTG